jgi:diguanylate cyclase (GGDEF)-like protein
MPPFAIYWLALAILLGALVYLWLRDRTRQARVAQLSTELERRSAELEEAHQALNRLAGLDALTGLPNHSAFQEFLRGEWRRALREASTISILMIDLDRFSEYNDRLGHQSGDDCLVKIARKLKEVVRRPGDLVARYGGEEFAVVMSRTDSQGAFRVAHRICAAVEGLAIEHPESDVSPCLTVSVGVATSTPAVDSNWEELELVAGANAALEKAKQAGRNRVGATDSG